MATDQNAELNPVERAIQTGALSLRTAQNDAPLPSDDMLRSISSFADAEALIRENYGEVTDFAKEFGTGFALLESAEKERLVKTPFLVLYWRIHQGDFGGGFISAAIVTEKDDKYIITDGSSGIYRQLAQITFDTGKNTGLLVRKGLRVSTYDICVGERCGVPRTKDEVVCQECGDESERRATGRTFYLDNS